MGRSVPRRAKRLSCLSPPRGFRLPRPGCSRRLHCEALEDRRLLTITVDTLLDELDGSIVDGDISLRDAIAAATPDETIDFHTSLDGGTVLLTLGELAINQSLTIDATALPGGLTIDASGNDPTPDTDNGNGSRIFYIDDGDGGTDSPVAIGGLTLTGGNLSGRGGAILARETLTVTSSTISGNSASAASGGGIWASGSVTVTNSTISGNSAEDDGGGIRAYGSVAVTSSTISGNSADRGGGIRARRDVMVTASAIAANSAHGEGGAIYSSFGHVTVVSSTIAGNSAGLGSGTFGGGFVMLTVCNSIITRDEATGDEDIASSLTSESGFNRFSSANSLSILGAARHWVCQVAVNRHKEPSRCKNKPILSSLTGPTISGCAKLARTALSDRGILGRARAHQDSGNRVAKSGVPALAGRASAGAACRCGELGTPCGHGNHDRILRPTATAITIESLCTSRPT